MIEENKSSYIPYNNAEEIIFSASSSETRASRDHFFLSPNFHELCIM